MKRFLFSIIFTTLYFFSGATVITWIGISGGNWNTASNWFPASVPTSTDDVVFSTSVIVEMDILSASTYTINSLLITGSSNVTLQRTEAAGGIRVLQVASTSAVTKGLQINNGSTLIIDAVNGSGTLNYQLALTGGTDVTGEISGNLYFIGNGLGTGDAQLNLYQDPTNYASLTVKNLGVIKYFTNTGNTSPTTGSYLTMESGSEYEIAKNGGSFPPGSWNPGSLAKVTGTTNAGPTFHGTTYGNLEWNATSQTAAAVIGKDITFNNVDIVNTGLGLLRVKGGTGTTTFTMTVNGSLVVSVGTILETSGISTTSGNPGIISVKGNITNNGIIRENSSVPNNEFQLTGTSAQTISGTGSWSGDGLTFVMNNSAGAILNSPLSLPYNLSLTSGKIATTSINLLTMIDNATYTGGSTSSFIDGPMKKIGDDNFSFPVGKGSIFAPIGITNVSGQLATDEYTAEYIRSNPQSVHGTNYQGVIDHISYVEYWSLNRNLGSGTKDVTLQVTQYSFATSLSTLFVVSFDSPQWVTHGLQSFTTGTPSPPYVTGTITSFGTSLDGDFTIATSDPFAVNPLPIKLLSFNAVKINNRLSRLNWELAVCCSSAARFEVQKSTDGRNYSTFTTLTGRETNRFYVSTDNNLGKGITYYRLKMVDVGNVITYSKTIAIVNDSNEILITSLAPNPVHSNAMITVSTAKATSVDFKVFDMSGNMVKQWQSNMAEGNNTITINVDGLAAGLYHILAGSNGAKAFSRFIKQ